MTRSVAIGLAWALVSLAHPVWAVDRTAASCNSADVQSTIDSSADGDVVIIPAGNCTWTNVMVSTNGRAIKLIGNSASPSLPSQGADGAVTITLDNTLGRNGPPAFLNISEATTRNVEVSNLTFVQAGTGTDNSHNSANSWMILVAPVVGGRPISFHHNTMVFHICGPGTAIYTGANRGVFWRNKFLNDRAVSTCGWLNSTTAINVAPNVTDGTALWNSPSTLGALDTNGNQNLYFETNHIVNFTNNATDQDDGSRLVVRYNTFLDSAGAGHGHDSSPVGARQLEYYNNTFLLTSPTGDFPANIARWILVRGGTGVITDNVMPVLNQSAWGGLKPNVQLTLFSLFMYQCYRGTYPWLHQIGWGWNGSVDAHGDAQVLDPLYFWNNRVSPGGTLATGMEVVDLRNSCATPPPPQSDFLQAGRDYYNDLEAPQGRPGYVKYQYPHPLTSSQSVTSPSTLTAPSNLRIQ